jgi:hypothetical protein
MENFDLDSIYLSLKDSVNETLGDVAKDSIEGNNYQLLHIIAKIGIDVNAYIDGMFAPSSNDVAVIKAEVVDENVETSTTTADEVVTNKRSCIRGGYGVDANTVKNWVEEYLLKRGGRALKNDLYEMFYKTFSKQFNAYDISNGSDKPKWKQNVCDRIQTMRKNGIIAKSENGTEYHYYTLDPEYHANLKKSIQAQPTLPYTTEKEMTAEG